MQSQDLDDSAAVPDQLLKSSEEQDPVTGTVSYTLQITCVWKLVTPVVTKIIQKAELIQYGAATTKHTFLCQSGMQIFFQRSF